MDSRSSLKIALGLTFVAISVSSSSSFGAETKAPVAKVSAEAKAAYPLNTCVVSGDKLEEGTMGGPVDYVYKAAGKPDRLIRFCCKDCIKDFEKEPAKYLKTLDEAEAAAATAKASGAKK